MDVNFFLILTSAILLAIGLVGTVVPILPGVPLAWAGLLTAHFCARTQTPIFILVITGLVAILVTVADTILQPYLTKKFGGSKNAVWGATIGLFVALFLGPLFIIIAPFIGALIGELISTPNDSKHALKAASGAFLGFLLGTGIKMICVIAFIWIFIFELIK